jgi:uncharacterized damage-inducible protein DinB
MQTLTQDLAALFGRDLGRLSKEIAGFQQEENLWRITGGISNPAGNLCLHLVGNLNTYVGANLGGSGYVRNREAEFSLRDVARTHLLDQVTQVRDTVVQTLEQLTDSQLHRPYPEQVLGYEMSTAFFLMHLLGHLNYHLGQINYLRRVLE